MPSDAAITAAGRHRVTRRLVAARLLAGLSQEDLARGAGISRQAVSAWEAADGDITLTTAVTWAHLLGFDLGVGPTRGVPVLVDDTGRPVPWRTLAMHVAVTGPDRAAVLDALTADCGGLPIHSIGAPVGEELSGAALDAFLARLADWDAGPCAVVVEVDERDERRHALVREVLGRARANGVIVIVSCAGDIPSELRHNVTLHLHAEGGDITDEDGCIWRLLP